MKIVFLIFHKEVSAFFNSLIAYIVVVVFLAGNGLFFWIFPDNILETGAAQADVLFAMAPWLFLFLAPAVTMRAFAEEFKTGTFEFMATKPLDDRQLILGKYLAAVALIFLAVVPTLVYIAAIYLLADPVGAIDLGAIAGAYLGLIGVGAVFAAIGIFASSLTDNQIVAFLTAAFVCFFVYAAFDLLAELPFFINYNHFILLLGLQEHYRSISRGVVDTRDVLYFLSLIVFFLLLTQALLDRRR
jgi:ABC-2 type transport system permease protein